MAGRSRLPPDALTHREASLRAPPPLHPSVLEDRLIAQHREIQSLLLDNQRLAATHVALKQELSAVQQELRHVSAASLKVKAERDAQVREVYDRSLNLEDELRSVDAAHAELTQVRSDIKKLSSARQELSSQLQEINDEIKRARSELLEAPLIKAEIDGILQELQRGRAAIEYEKKIRSDNQKHSEAMQRHMATMAHEIDKLRAELANAQKRARATAAAAAAAASPGPVYSGGYGNPETGYGVTAHVDTYNLHKVHGGADVRSQYGPGTVSHSPYDMQQSHLHR